MLRRLGFALDSSLAKPSAAGRVGIASRALLRKIHRSQYLKEEGQLGAAAHGYFGIRGCLWLLFSKILNLGTSVNSQPGASMRILFDQGVPGGLTASLRSHDVTEARKLNWEKVANGALLRLAEDTGYIRQFCRGGHSLEADEIQGKSRRGIHPSPNFQAITRRSSGTHPLRSGPAPVGLKGHRCKQPNRRATHRNPASRIAVAKSGECRSSFRCFR